MWNEHLFIRFNKRCEEQVCHSSNYLLGELIHKALLFSIFNYPILNLHHLKNQEEKIMLKLMIFQMMKNICQLKHLRDLVSKLIALLNLLFVIDGITFLESF